MTRNLRNFGDRTQREAFKVRKIDPSDRGRCHGTSVLLAGYVRYYAEFFSTLQAVLFCRDAIGKLSNRYAACCEVDSPAELLELDSLEAK